MMEMKVQCIAVQWLTDCVNVSRLNPGAKTSKMYQEPGPNKTIGGLNPVCSESSGYFNFKIV